MDFILLFRDLLWGKLIIFLLVFAGLYLSLNLKFVQFKYLIVGFKYLLCPKKTKATTKGDISSFQSLMTALAGAIGTGNIAGIATAVTIGGFGALFWMWVMAGIGMCVAYSETLLGVKYRRKNKAGEFSGGPMYTLLYGNSSPSLAAIYSILCALMAFGYALVQSNSVADAILDVYPISRIYIGIILAAVTGMVTIGGVKSIGRVAGILVPVMAILYLSAGLIVIIVFHANLLPAIKLIITSAFTGQAAVGSFVGSTVFMAIQSGAQYGIFANEAGLGSLAIAGASAKTDYSAKQGIFAITGVFISTMMICTITGLSLAVTNVLGGTYNEAQIAGSPMVMAAFGKAHYYFRYVVISGLILFAFTTIFAWSYYGEKCIEFLTGLKLILPYRLLLLLVVAVGAVLELEIVWAIALIINGLMIIPNLISIVGLLPVVKAETKSFEESISPGASL
jgi:alanine or glycine:cation symporter, AGCS family